MGVFSTSSLWMKPAELPDFAPLNGDVRVDVCVIGGFLFVPPSGAAGVLRRELDAAHRAGLSHVEWLAARRSHSTPAPVCAFQARRSVIR